MATLRHSKKFVLVFFIFTVYFNVLDNVSEIPLLFDHRYVHVCVCKLWGNSVSRQCPHLSYPGNAPTHFQTHTRLC
jgi:hypothetical protein